MKKTQKTPFTLAIGASLLSGLSMNAAAESNPFTMDELSSGYMQTAEAQPAKDGADKMKGGACGEGKCGAAMQKGGDAKAATEGKCAGNKPAAPAPADDKSKQSQ